MSMNREEKLETNELGHALQSAGQQLESHATKIVAGVCGVLVIAAAIIWFSRQSSSKSVQAWSQLEQAQDVSSFGEIAEAYPNQLAGQWGRLKESELNLQTGLSAMFRDREVALIDLKKAIEGFDALIAGASEKTIRERALWGAAVGLEATCDGDTSKASAAFQRLLKEVPDTFYKQLAEQRIEALKTADTQAFYAWFSKQKPKPTDVRPKDGVNPHESIMLPGGGLPALDDVPAESTKTSTPEATPDSSSKAPAEKTSAEPDAKAPTVPESPAKEESAPAKDEAAPAKEEPAKEEPAPAKGEPSGKDAKPSE